MTINITSGSSGWGNYVLYGTKDKPRESDKVEFLEGDIALGDRLSQSNNYEESYYKIVLAFEGKPSDEVIKSAYEDFKKEMFVGFNRDEYHIDAVIHKDTDNYHIHARVPKQNLKTDTHLQLYMDKIDRPRKQLIQDHLSLKYGFEIAREKDKKIFKEENTKIDIINKWREENNQKPFDLKSKEGKKEAEQQINSYVSDLIKSELITSQDDVKSTLEDLGLKVEKFGHDEKKDFYYATVSNESGKMRIKGDVYNDRFYEYNAKDRSSQIENNRRIIEEREPNQERAERVRKELNRENEKRFNKVTKLFKHSRTRAEQEHKQTLENGRVESLNTNKHTKHSNISSSNDIHNKSNELKEAPKLYKRQNDRRHKRTELSQISSKRVNLRQTKTSVLLQNQLKERANERLINETIRRIREQREASATALQRARSSRELVQDRVARNHKELQNGVSKIADYYGKIRTKVVNTINEMKEKLSEAKKRFLGKTDSIDKKNSLSERFKSVDKSVQTSTQENKSDSSHLDKRNEIKDERFLAQKERLLEKQQEREAPVKKRSYGRSGR